MSGNRTNTKIGKLQNTVFLFVFFLINFPFRFLIIIFLPVAVPLLASEAKPISAAKLKKERETWNVTRVKGQHLEGVMIPTIEDTIHPESDDGEGADGTPLDVEDDVANAAGETKPLMNGKKKPIYTAWSFFTTPPLLL